MTDKTCVFYYLRFMPLGFPKFVRASEPGLKSNRFFSGNGSSRHVPDGPKNGFAIWRRSAFPRRQFCGAGLPGWKGCAAGSFEVPDGNTK
jgi:hypothetical protein